MEIRTPKLCSSDVISATQSQRRGNSSLLRPCEKDNVFKFGKRQFTTTEVEEVAARSKRTRTTARVNGM
jgi:hypothetical protein